MSDATTPREFDLILWGATGFTGRLVAEYLAGRPAGAGAPRWAIAGRDRAKLDATCEELARGVPGFDASRLPRLLADSGDLDALRALARRARVVLSTVGPYARFGSELVQACAENGTDYCDLSGELQWIHRMIASWHDTARDSGARIVHCCGFDSVPFDMGVWHLQQQMFARHGTYASRVQGVVTAIRGSFSGGTYASMLNFVAQAARDPALRRMVGDPDALIPAQDRPARRGAAPPGVAYNTALGTWTAPFVMAVINTRIVRRGNALLGWPWGRDFGYEESVATGAGLGGRLRALGIQAGMAAFLGTAATAPGRALLTRALPAPGEGPDAESRRRGHFEITFVADVPGGGGRRLCTRVRGDADPGYGSTSKMLAECGLCLARDNLPTPGGSWTPAAALGGALLQRLQAHAGLSFESPGTDGS